MVDKSIVSKSCKLAIFGGRSRKIWKFCGLEGGRPARSHRNFFLRHSIHSTVIDLSVLMLDGLTPLVTLDSISGLAN